MYQFAIFVDLGHAGDFMMAIVLRYRLIIVLQPFPQPFQCKKSVTNISKLLPTVSSKSLTNIDLAPQLPPL